MIPFPYQTGQLGRRVVAQAGATDPNFANVVLLLLMNGANGGTSFPDSSSSAKTVSSIGGAQTSTAQIKYGSASGLFNGSTQYLSIADSADFAFGSGSFTIETWARPSSVTTRQIMSGQINATTTELSTSVIFEITAGGRLRSYAFSGTTLIWNITGTTALSVNTWYHFAVCRDGTTVRIFVDGNIDGTATGVSAAVNDSGTIYSIGRGGEFNGLYYNGYLDDYRITKGVARYTAAFTPPTEQLPTS